MPGNTLVPSGFAYEAVTMATAVTVRPRRAQRTTSTQSLTLAP